MPNEWYYAKAGQREGPISFDNLKQLVQQGQIRPADHVWKQGMAAWAPASTVDGLCGVEPPPLPPPAAIMPRLTSSPLPALTFTKDGMTEWLRWIDAHKVIVCAVPLAVCFLIGGVLALIAQDSVWLLVALSIGSVPFWIFRSRTLQQNKRRKLLYGMWEPVNGQGIYFQFTKDGALVRGDGVATRYRWLADDKLELFMDDSTPTVTIDVLSMSDKELIVRADGQGGHFRRGMTITEAEAEAQAEVNRQAAWGAAGAVAKGAGMLALGGLAVLGGMAAGVAAGVAAGGGGGGTGSSDARWCPKCGKSYGLMDKLRQPSCMNCGAKLP
jgi:hypothetical protein